MHKWYSSAAISTMGLFTACAAPSPIPIVDTEAAPKTIIATKTNQITPSTPEPVAISPIPENEPQRNVEPSASERHRAGPFTAPATNDEEENGEFVEGGVSAGVPWGISGGTPGGVVGGQAAGISSGSASGLPPGVFRAGDSQLAQERCPHPGAPTYPKAAKDAKVETRIVARCIVETNGSMSNCKLLASHPLFEKPMLDHLKKANVPPMTTIDGKPARVQCTYVYRFKMQ